MAIASKILLPCLLGVFVRASMNVGQSDRAIQRQHPVCIVGAGPTGLAAAHALEVKNYSVVVFDKQPEVGGKCQAYYDGDQKSLFHAMGALLISNASYIDTVPIVEAAGVPFLPALSVTSGWIYPPVLANTSVVNVTRTPNPSPAQTNLLESEFSRYTDLRNKIFELYGTMRYTNGIPGDLTIPIGQWLSQNRFQVLPIVINAGLLLISLSTVVQFIIITMCSYQAALILLSRTPAFTVKGTEYNMTQAFVNFGLDYIRMFAPDLLHEIEIGT
ncbi:hypothetical protein D9758_017055 [Tetrapyrgos nigripes]|uniref:Uncharacterized protein n=1 Tax=Tetrapyrgos nigripes TaxID=182062 RepID=A0A8H5CM41_9AGAR|nr:hypothetical protein D9758_017055 [Tetrapyrgos nigripes]